jgi:hypothetical protein
MLSGVHELLHLVHCTKKFGPLNLVNCFQFEELNRKILGVIHGKDLIGEEFIKMFFTVQNLSCIDNKNENKIKNKKINSLLQVN